MRPLKLVIQGLHSFKDKQTIDFESLCIGGLFGIFGPTGSGKSSILDAITLALYGEVVRAENKTDGILNHGEDTLFVSLTFQLGLKGEEKRYAVERTYKRTKGVTINAESCILTDITSKPIVIAEREEKVNHAVEALLGLSISDFISSVFLPIERFLEILLVKGPNRKKKLLSLFHFKKCDACILANLRSLILKRNHNNYLMEQELQNRCTLVLEKQNEIEHLTQKISNAKEAKTLLPFLKELDTYLIDYRQLEKELEEAKFCLIDSKNQAKEKELQFIEAKRKKEDRVSAIQLQIAELKRVKHNQETLKIEKKQMVEIEKQFIQVKSKYEEKIILLNKAKEERKRYEQKKLELEQSLSNLELEVKDKQIVFLAIHNKQDVDIAWMRYLEMVTKIDDLNRKNEILDTRLEKLRKDIAEIEHDLGTRFQQMFHWYNRVTREESETRSLLNFLKNLKEDLQKENLHMLVTNLREKLVDGKPCIVCDRIHHQSIEEVKELEKITEEQQDILWVDNIIDAVQVKGSELGTIKMEIR